MNPDEQLRLMKVSHWYITWSLVFAYACAITEIIAIIETIRHRLGSALLLLVLTGVVWLFSRYLRGKSRQYRQRARDMD